MYIWKYQKSPWEAQFWKDRNAFNTTHSDSERKSLLFFWWPKTSKSMKIHSNSCLKWIMKSARLQHCSNWASLWLFKKAYKTSAILLICSNRPQNYVFQMFQFSTYLSNIVKWPLRAPVELPETPRDASESPDKHQNHCQWATFKVNHAIFKANHVTLKVNHVRITLLWRWSMLFWRWIMLELRYFESKSCHFERESC